MISIRNLCKIYNGHVVLNDVSLDIKKGSVTAITGPSGSGKSTFLRCINNLESPSSGTITIDGLPSTDKKILGKIGMVFQHFYLFPHMNVIENLTYAPIKVLKQSKAEAVEKAKLLLGKIGLSHKQQAMPNNLSGGQKQRAAIARTLMMSPEIILFDEPTSALDPEMVKEVLEVIKNLATSGITILIVTHEMGFAKETASDVLFFDHGKLAETGSPHEFFDHTKTERARIFLSKIMA
jgi:polar amino acid transport system ATP-binding protein